MSPERSLKIELTFWLNILRSKYNLIILKNNPINEWIVHNTIFDKYLKNNVFYNVVNNVFYADFRGICNLRSANSSIRFWQSKTKMSQQLCIDNGCFYSKVKKKNIKIHKKV